jgi:hypothetical protein
MLCLITKYMTLCFIERSFLNVNQKTFHISNFYILPLHLEIQVRVANVVMGALEIEPFI